MKIWVVMANSESGDDYGCIAAFTNKPSSQQLRELITYNNIGDDGCDQEDEGPGHFGSWLYLNVQDVDLTNN